jgi:predicted transcriptional regulator
MLTNNFKDCKYLQLKLDATVEDLQLPEAICIFQNRSISEALTIMSMQDFSQLPVIDNNRKLIGIVSLDKISKYTGDPSDPVAIVTSIFGKQAPYFPITPSTRLADLESFFRMHHAGFVTDGVTRWPLAVITKDDVDRVHAKKINV